MTPEKLKELLETYTGKNELVVYVKDGDSTHEIRGENYVQESLKLNQKLLKGNELRFGGCIASCFQLKVFDLDFPISKKEIQVDLSVRDGDDCETIHLFHGKVADVEFDRDTGVISITAYDALGFAGDKVAIIMPTYLYAVRKYLLQQLSDKSGLSVQERKKSTDYTFVDYYSTTLGSAVSITIAEALRCICELNGTFGFIDGEGFFSEVDIFGGSDGGSLSKKVISNTCYLYTNQYGIDYERGMRVSPGKKYTIYSNISVQGQEIGPIKVTFFGMNGNTVGVEEHVAPISFTVPDGTREIGIEMPANMLNMMSSCSWEKAPLHKEAVDIIVTNSAKFSEFKFEKPSGVKYYIENKDGESDEKHTDVLSGTNDNPYTIEKNAVFEAIAYKENIVESLFAKIKNMQEFTPAKSVPSVGYPGTVNVGDYVNSGEEAIYVLSRTLTGIRGLKDAYSCDTGSAFDGSEPKITTEYIVNEKLDNSIKSISTEYYLSNSATSLSGGSWSSGRPEWADGKYIWMRQITTLNNGTDTVGEPVCISGSKGDNGQDAVLLRIESSKGTVFKNDNMSTVLSVVIYKGSQRVTDIEMLRLIFGDSAYLQWKWQRLDEDSFGIISSSDKHLSNDGFTYTISSDEIDTKVTFMCELVV